MATTQTPKLDKVGLSHVWAKIVENFAAQAIVNALQEKLNNIEAGAEVNIIESVSVNGTQVTVSEKNINIEVPTGTLAELDEVGIDDLNSALQELINGKAAKATTLAGYGITDSYTKTETDAQISNAVKTAVAGVYKVKGSIAFASIPTQGMASGDVYNITDAFTTTSAFVEGVGKEHPAGTNVVYTDKGWDCMSGTYDFSDYMLKTDLVDITEAEIDEICTMPA